MRFATFAIAAGTAFLLAASASATDTKPTIFLIGDSTLADKPTEPPNPERGWGQLLPRYFKDSSMIQNHAVNGRSTKSFINEGRWDEVRRNLKPGDWVIIQFGHNDEKYQDPTRYAPARGAFIDNLRRFIAEAHDAGSTPILATPVMRRRFDENGHFFDTHGDYPDAVRELAAELHVPLLDLHALTRELIQGHGPEGSKRLFLWIAPGTFERKPEGYADDTHFSAYGADRVAALAVQEIIRLQLPIGDWLKP